VQGSAVSDVRYYERQNVFGENDLVGFRKRVRQTIVTVVNAKQGVSAVSISSVVGSILSCRTDI